MAPFFKALIFGIFLAEMRKTKKICIQDIRIRSRDSNQTCLGTQGKTVNCVSQIIRRLLV